MKTVLQLDIVNNMKNKLILILLVSFFICDFSFSQTKSESSSIFFSYFRLSPEKRISYINRNINNIPITRLAIYLYDMTSITGIKSDSIFYDFSDLDSKINSINKEFFKQLRSKWKQNIKNQKFYNDSISNRKNTFKDISNSKEFYLLLYYTTLNFNERIKMLSSDEVNTYPILKSIIETDINTLKKLNK